MGYQACNGANNMGYNTIIGYQAGQTLNSNTADEATNNMAIGNGAEPTSSTTSH